VKQKYDWQRFWCPRSSQINLADSGYLYDPDEKWGLAYNQDLVKLEKIADVPCLILLGEPGIGKSHELENLKDFTEQNICDPNQVLKLNLRSCTNLKDDLFKDEIFTDWLGNTYDLYLFLDSLDEGLLNIQSLATGLIDELKKQKYRNHINRLYLRLACRTFVFPAILEQELKAFWKEAYKDCWQEDYFAIYELAPLRRIDVIEAAKAESFSADDFLREIDRKNVVALAIKPITLGFLLNTYRCHNSQFPPNQKLYELYRDGCKLLCEEVNKSRQASGKKGKFDSNQRLIIAARIAAVTILTNRFAIWTEVNEGNVPAEDIFIQTLYFGCETANGNRFPVTKEVIEEVLDTGLFSSRGSKRMGWAHQTYAEFLAAWYLTQHNLNLNHILELIIHPDNRVVPQLHETAAWLASMRTDVLEEIVNTDPDVLLRSDIPTDASFRELLVNNLLTQYEEGKLFDPYKNNYRNYEKLKHPGLADQLHPYICDSTKQIDARDLAIDIAEVCKISELQDELADLTLDSSQSIDLRVKAAKAICLMGDATTRLKLKPLAIKLLLEDEQDRLKGYILQGIWPDYLTVEELFQALTPPKKFLFSGSYQRFLNDQIVPQLMPDDLVVALNWLEKQGLRDFKHPFKELGDTIILKAWDNFYLPEVAESFTRIAFIQWRRYKKIITDDSQLHKQFSSLLQNNTRKRHTLLEQAVLLISETGESANILKSPFTDSVLISEDILWMLEKLQESDNENTHKTWAELIEWIFNPQDAKQIDAILVATQTNNILQEIFAAYFTPIELDSTQAKKDRAKYIEWQEMQARSQNPQLLDPPPKERVILFLEQLETGDLSAWWQLNMEMTLKPDDRSYGNEFELDITQLPGWKDAEKVTRERIVEGAKKYINQFDDINYEWIGTNTVNPDIAALAGCRALQLLLQESPDFIDNLSSEVWKRWASIIIAPPIKYHLEESYLELVKRAYLNAPEEFINTVIKLIDRHSQENQSLSLIYRLEKCWDERLQLAILEKAKDPTLKAECVGELLEELLKQGLTETKVFAQSLISLPLPSDKNEREKVLIAARILVENSDSDSWLFLWELIQQDSSFGREIFELVAERYSFGFPLNLTETQLADLYIWLVHQYPYNEDPDYSDEVMDHIMTARYGIGKLRNSVLQQLEKKGSLQACTEIQRIIQVLPNITWLGKRLINAQTNMRRITWKYPTPEEFIQLIISREPLNSDLSNQLDTIDQRTKKMEDEPKIDNRVDNSIKISESYVKDLSVNNSSNSSDSSMNQPVSNSDSKKGINWGNWIGVISIILAILAIFGNGLFNEEIKQWLNDFRSPQVEQQSTPQNK
jgi:predicted NACHT family NTPase